MSCIYKIEHPILTDYICEQELDGENKSSAWQWLSAIIQRSLFINAPRTFYAVVLVWINIIKRIIQRFNSYWGVNQR